MEAEVKSTTILLLFDQRVEIDKGHDVVWVKMVTHLQVATMSRVVVVV